MRWSSSVVQRGKNVRRNFLVKKRNPSWEVQILCKGVYVGLAESMAEDGGDKYSLEVF